MKYICNPVNFPYQYQFNQSGDGKFSIDREAADPSMVYFKGHYLIFPSMTCGFLYSEDLAKWEFHPLKELPVYDYAPDIRVVGEWLYFCASSHEHCVFYRTKDPFSGQYETFESSFTFWDPNLFQDEDGRLYFYWGSSSSQPIYGVELDPETMQPLGERVPLFTNDEAVKGFERRGEDHVPTRTSAEKEAMRKQVEAMPMSDERRAIALDYISDAGYIEGAWMNKHNGRYYLQYGTPGAQFNIYADGVYVSDNPLGPFTLAKNNPYSYKPGGFLPGAGHGSTLQDGDGSVWHTSTMRVSMHHVFERRIGIWPAGWDEDGELYCNQRYGDWPYTVERFRQDPWADPEWMLLSYGKEASASSCEEGHEAANAADENVRTWWKAASNRPGEWLALDLGRAMDVRAVQVNFADDVLSPEQYPEIDQRLVTAKANMVGTSQMQRWIDIAHQPTRWKLEGSLDGADWFVLEDKSEADTDLPHDFVFREDGVQVRHIRLTVLALPYRQNACVSGLRVFGLGHGEKPEQVVSFTGERRGELDIHLRWPGNAVGYMVNFGYAAEKLYHSYQVFQPEVHLGGLVAGQDTYVRIDSFNESGITEGICLKVQ